MSFIKLFDLKTQQNKKNKKKKKIGVGDLKEKEEWAKGFFLFNLREKNVN
jgi:hypothetical protein